MNRKILTLLTAASFALFFGACGDDNSSSTGPNITCDTEDCLDDDENLSSSDDEEPASSSSKKDDAKSSSSVKEDKTSSSSEAKDDDKSSSSAKEDKDDDKSSSSEAKDESSSSEKVESSSSESESSSSEEPESSSSEEVKPVEYANTTPNLADLEVSGDTLFAVFQRQNADYSITHNGLLVMYKLSDGTVLDTIQLATKNPSAVKVAGGNVYVATAGTYDETYTLVADANRGIEKVDLSKKTSSLLIAGTKLGGGVNDFVVDKKNNKGYAMIYSNWMVNAKVVEVNLSTGSITKTISGLKDPQGSLEFDATKNVLYIGDRGDSYTFEDIMVYSYDGSTLTPYVELDEEDDEFEFRQAYSIKAIAGVPYVFVSDYKTGALYVDFADLYSDGTAFYQDSKLAAVNGELFLMERDNAATIAKINTADGSVAWQSVATGKNPYDMVAASSTTAWVAYYGSPVLELISTSNGSSVKLIDTKEFCAVKVD